MIVTTVLPRLDEQIFTLELNEPGTHGLVGWTTKYSARGHIELTAVTWARHSRAIKYSTSSSFLLRQTSNLIGSN